MRDVLAVIMGGGQGTRLRPLTSSRAKPAVPFAGKYRLIDIPISNCLHAGIDRIFVLTQFKSASLNRHVQQTYRFDAFSQGHVTILAAELTGLDETSDRSDWYQGTADAVRKQLRHFVEDLDGDVVILSGDQVYSMRLDEMVRMHREAGSEVTIACTPVCRAAATRFGVVKVDSCHWVSAFAEKPSAPNTLDDFSLPAPVGDNTHLASMGIYVFRARTLKRLLETDDRHDFGSDIIPRAIAECPVLAYPFEGYWEDVGTLESYHRVNLELSHPLPPYSLFDDEQLLLTRPRFLPPAKLGRVSLDSVLLCDGAIVGDGSRIHESVLGIRAVIGRDCDLDRVVCNGAGAWPFGPRSGDNPLGIGDGSVLRNVIVDRDAHIGRGVRLVNERGLSDYEDEHIVVRSGIIAVPRQAVIPDGYVF